MQSVALEYLPILLFAAVGLAISAVFVGAPILISNFAGTNKPETVKLAEYECGFESFGDARRQFDVRFYLVSILFIVFDLEVAFLFPWAVSLKETGHFGWWSMMEFLAELALGLAYAWKVGALDWE